MEQSLTTPECQFSHKQRRVETVGFHPTADYLLHSTAAGSVNLWDLTAQKEVFGSNEHPDVIQSLSWKLDGTLLTTSCKDKVVRIIDPRSNVPITMAADSHQSIKDSRVVWLGDQTRILSTGFDAARLRQIIIRDLRNFNAPEKTLELDCSTGVLMPLYDPDTNMLFLAGKGDTTIAYMEVTDKDPYLIEGLRHNGNTIIFFYCFPTHSHSLSNISSFDIEKCAKAQMHRKTDRLAHFNLLLFSKLAEIRRTNKRCVPGTEACSSRDGR